MNQITITGATGIIGRRVVRELVMDGRQVTGVTGSARGRRLLEALGARAVDADVFDSTALAAAFAGADAVVNLLTRIPTADRIPVPAAWEHNDRLRRDASAAVARAAADAGARRLVQESLAFVYADGGDRWLDEDAPLEPWGSVTTVVDAEHNATTLLPGDTVILRFGLFIGPDSHLTLNDIARAAEGRSTRLGRPAAYLPTVWLDYAARAVVAALDAPPGVYNVVDDDPPTRADVDAALAAVTGQRTLRASAPPRAVALPPTARSQRLSNRRLREATGWAPRMRAGTEIWGRIAA
jgi:UDP-glucose 4-epimerase